MIFAGANLSEALITVSNFSDVDLHSATADRLWVVWSLLDGANMSGVQCVDCKISTSDLRGVDLSGAVLDCPGCEKWAYGVTNTDLEGAKLDDASLVNTDLRCSYAVGTTFENADFTDANTWSLWAHNASFLDSNVQSAENWGIIRTCNKGSGGRRNTASLIEAIEELEAKNAKLAAENDKLKAEIDERFRALEERMQSVDGAAKTNTASSTMRHTPLYAGLLLGMVGLALFPLARRRRNR